MTTVFSWRQWDKVLSEVRLEAITALRDDTLEDAAKHKLVWKYVLLLEIVVQPPNLENLQNWIRQFHDVPTPYSKKSIEVTGESG
jgi:hypothetical protein